MCIQIRMSFEFNWKDRKNQRENETEWEQKKYDKNLRIIISFYVSLEWAYLDFCFFFKHCYSY